MSAALAHDGVMASPHMVSKVVSGDGDTLRSYEDGIGPAAPVARKMMAAALG